LILKGEYFNRETPRDVSYFCPVLLLMAVKTSGILKIREGNLQLWHNSTMQRFKMEAIRRLERTGESVAKVAADLGINENTMHGWVKRYREKSATPFPGSGKLSDEDEKIRRLEKKSVIYKRKTIY